MGKCYKVNEYDKVCLTNRQKGVIIVYECRFKMIVVYPGGYHGEFFIGNIVEQNSNKFYYHSFNPRENNAYTYIPIEGEKSHSTSDDDLSRYENIYKKKIIIRTHNHRDDRKYPVLRLSTQDPYYMRRCTLLQTAKSFYIKSERIPPRHIKKPPMNLLPISDVMTVIDIAKWLHNDMQTIHEIEQFFGIKYNEEMKQNVIEYYNRDEIILKKYFNGWTSWSDEYLLERILVVWKKHNMLDKL